MTGRKASSSVCQASSNVLFSEGPPYGMSVVDDVRGLCSLRAGCCHFQKRLKKKRS